MILEEPDEDLVLEEPNKELIHEELNEKLVLNLDLVPMEPKMDPVLEELN